MIRLTRLGGQALYLNSDLIEFMEATPDTIIVMTSGKRVIVIEQPAEVVKRIVEYRRRIVAESPS
ncbi:MAG: flagellar protein FlbD [Proteobacteria bacterium]|jgi:flagellar protein FlbD|nr:flagellar protein FlbD [Pseudomonadota bacterium]NCV20386.1 flagellar protein FlbD [Chloroflexota bacterium]NBQ61723.1 flagellar protein FlbD [Pseudomonadota bacterium]NBT02852.1 flagellar protein FlbD [Pseudomonadota bacterium]NBT17410.1 flagellar protein FlbD [Pseudomonadota bacterium]